MANNGWVKSRRKIDPKQISSIIEELNQRLFKGNLQVETKQWPNGGVDWTIKYISGDKEWAYKYCWLETPHHFEMSHNGGGDFAWWLDTVILNEVAVKFNGTIYDDGIPDRIKGEPGKYDSLAYYLSLLTLGGVSKENKAKQWFKQLFALQRQSIPPEFRKELV